MAPHNSQRPRKHPHGRHLLAANVRARVAWGLRRELRKRLFAGRALVPCCFCARLLDCEEATLEHVLPRSRGGPTLIENLRISCEPCNREREDWGFEKLRGRRAGPDESSATPWPR
jgi:5-methylcytosine-specific restriction endonuclease McrA